jgi:putative ABC transport system substrate-binding protein
LELLRELVPSLSKVGIIRNPANAGEVVAVEATQAIARNLGMTVLVEHAARPGDLERVITAIAVGGAQAVIVLPDPMFLANRSELIRLINQARLPAIYMETGFVASGGLMSYGPNFTQLFRRAATYVDKILKGANPADMAVEQPTKFELIINQATANALGLTIPQSILLRADEFID